MRRPASSVVTAGQVVLGLVVTLPLAAWFVAGASPATGSAGQRSSWAAAEQVEVVTTTTPLADGSCGATFVAHDLAHTTRPTDGVARLFDSNGAGVAADDLDGDGWPDIVLGNLEGPNTVLWNEGDWRFTSEVLPDRSTRAVQLVDVDADGLLDIVTTHRGAGVALFRNMGDRSFAREPLPGVSAPAYSMAWGDVDGDGDLDLATGSYDAELDQQLRSTFLFSDGAGIHLYDRKADGSFVATRLVEESQALATHLVDLDLDGALDLVVGNDFSVPDMVWANTGDGTMQPDSPFTTTSAHTMSLESGDVDNDGIEELFATDMKPVSTDVEVLAEWLPLMETMDELDDPTDPQQIRNVLQVPVGDGRFEERAERAGVDASGWAWSGRFGDLDNDGDNDLYVVNGMIAADTFWYLDDGAIDEPNIAYANRGDGTFGVADWGLDALASGRGSVLVDLDRDGRLDVVVNNLAAPATAFENRLCDQGHGLAVDLRQPATANTHAIGAEVRLVTTHGVQVRVVRSGGGYLSGSPSTLHFGVPDGVEPVSLEVRWPDGARSVVDRPRPNTALKVERP